MQQAAGLCVCGSLGEWEERDHMLDIGLKILDAIKVLFGFKESLAKSRIERRQRMSDAFSGVAACLAEAAAEIRAGSYPAGRCQEMLTYAVALPKLADEELGEASAQEVGQALTEAHRVEMLFAERDSPHGLADLARLRKRLDCCGRWPTWCEFERKFCVDGFAGFHATVAGGCGSIHLVAEALSTLFALIRPRRRERHVLLERIIAQELVGAGRGVAFVVGLAGVAPIDAERPIGYPTGALAAAPVLLGRGKRRR